jgi:hypothetical protein
MLAAISPLGWPLPDGTLLLAGAGAFFDRCLSC